jgi:C1A family cysteine protease
MHLLKLVLFPLYVTLLSSSLVFSTDLNLTEQQEWNEFLHFQKKYDKYYDSLDQFEARFEIFRDNLQTIISHNLHNNFNFTLEVNHFTDLTPEEFKKYYTNPLLESNRYGCKSFSTADVNSNTDDLPVSIDWRKKGAVTSVKDQGQCGSCWAFSSTAATEGAWAISSGELIDLSEQELVDCAIGFNYGSHGCSGGQMDGGFKFIIENGLCSATEYPYTSGTTKTEGSCQGKKCDSVIRFEGMASCSDVSPSDELLLNFAVAQQPVAVAIEADTRYFQFYSGGILDSVECGTKLDHGVLIVGYGEEDGKKYWLVKNSWSSSWGEDGYVKIARSDSRNNDGICGIAMSPSFIQFHL